MFPTTTADTLTTPSRRAAAVAAVLGLAPHVLHHAGLLAGSALIAGTGGALLFGAVGFLAAIPFLLRARRRCGNWRVPGALLAERSKRSPDHRAEAEHEEQVVST